jgi:signal transduction histidine kinase
VRVALREEAGSVVLEVHNEGPPIPPEVQAILFDPFRRGPQVTSREAPSDGLGLGLFISRQIVEAHGGSLDVTSEPGLGTAFTVRLPKGDPSGGELPR